MNKTTLSGLIAALLLTTFGAPCAWAAPAYELRMNVPGLKPAVAAPVAVAPTFGAWPLSAVDYNSGPYTLTGPTSTSAGAFSYTSSNPAVATVSGNTLTILGAGTANITAAQATAPGFTAGSVTSSLTVQPIDPALGSFTGIVKSYGEPAFTVPMPTSLSTGAFTYASSDPSVATVTGNQVTIRGAGMALITAAQAATANYRAGSTTAQLTINPIAPTISALAPVSKTYGDGVFNLSPASSNSPGPFTYTSSNTSVATISGSQVTVRGAGTTQIMATQAASGNYSGGTAAPATLTVAKATPTFDTYTLPFQTMGAASYVVTPPTTNPTVVGGPYTYTSSNPAVATISNGIITLVAAGSTTITATRTADANYNAASTSATLTVVSAANPSSTAWNPADKGADMAISSPLVASGGGAANQWEIVRANLGKNSGKYVFEMKTSISSANVSCGLASANASLNSQLGTSGVALGITGGGAYKASGVTPGVALSGYPCNSTTMFAVDLDAGKGWFTNSSRTTGTWIGDGSPSAGTSPTFTFAPHTVLFPAASVFASYGYTITANFGASNFVNQAPAGFTAGWY